MPKTAAPLLALLTGSAFAQTKIDRPFYGEIGVALPSAHGSDVGAEATLGASFFRRHGLTLSGQLRASGYDTGTELPGADEKSGEVFSPITFGLDARYRPHQGRVFVGASLDAAQTDYATDTSSSTTRLAYALETGVDFTKRLYGVVRYQATVDDLAAYRAFTVCVGFRF